MPVRVRSVATRCSAPGTGGTAGTAWRPGPSSAACGETAAVPHLSIDSAAKGALVMALHVVPHRLVRARFPREQRMHQLNGLPGAAEAGRLDELGEQLPPNNRW